MEIAVRRAQAADAPNLAALARNAYQHYVPRLGREPAPMTADYAVAVATDEVWLAEADDALLGFLVLRIEHDHVLLENVAVTPDAQGSGVGRRLLELADERAGVHGRTEIRLYTNEVMTENLDYYIRRGYVETHRAVEAGYHRVFFRKTLYLRKTL